MTTQTLESLAAQIADIKAERAGLTTRRLAIDSELSEINTAIRTSGGRLPRDRFNRYLRRQDELKREITTITQRQVQTKAQLQQVCELENKVFNATKGEAAKVGSADDRNSPVRCGIRDLHKKYSEFAADATRVASMRRMASEFAMDLQSLLKETKA